MSKYQVGKRMSWEIEHDIRFSEHALKRFDERAPNDSVSPERAWLESQDVSEVVDYVDNGRGLDELRLYPCRDGDPSAWLLFLAVDEDPRPQIVTVLTVDMIGHKPSWGYLWGWATKLARD